MRSATIRSFLQAAALCSSSSGDLENAPRVSRPEPGRRFPGTVEPDRRDLRCANSPKGFDRPKYGSIEVHRRQGRRPRFVEARLSAVAQEVGAELLYHFVCVRCTERVDFVPGDEIGIDLDPPRHRVQRTRNGEHEQTCQADTLDSRHVTAEEVGIVCDHQTMADRIWRARVKRKTPPMLPAGFRPNELWRAYDPIRGLFCFSAAGRGKQV